MYFQSHIRDVDDGVVRVSPSPGDRGHWHLWVDDGDHSDVSGEYDRMQLSPWIKTDTLVNLEDAR